MGCCPSTREHEGGLNTTDEEICAFEKKPRSAQRLADEDYDPESVVGENMPVVGTYSALIVAPSDPPALNTSLPRVSYVPEYVYGYRGFDCKQNLFFTSEGNLVYHIAALGIIMDPVRNVQKFFGGRPRGKDASQHDDDIMCLAVSPDGKLAATGQMGAKPKLFVWSTATGEFVCKYILSGRGATGIKTCTFSPDGQCVALVDMSADHELHVIRADSGESLWDSPCPCGKTEIYAVGWGPDNSIVTCGNKSVRFWNLETRDSRGGSGFGAQAIYAVSFDDRGKCYTGAQDGTIYVFKDAKVVQKLPNAHKGIITVVLWREGKLITAGQDQRVVVRDSDLSILGEVHADAVPRSADVKGDLLLVGNLRGTITLYEKFVYKNCWLGHNEGEVWGLDVTEDKIITSGDDNKLMVWDYRKRKAVSTVTVNEIPGGKRPSNAGTKSKLDDNQCARAVCYNPKTQEIALAANSGEVSIRDLATPDNVKRKLRCGERWIETVRYSPDGQLLAVGTHDNSVFVFSVPGYKFKRRLAAHASSVICLDWTKDGKYMRSLGEDFDLIFWKVPELVQEEAGATVTRDMEWDTQTVKLGWHVRGIYPAGVDKTHVNCAGKSHDGRLIVTGDDWGFVNIYNFPAGKGARCISLRYKSHTIIMPIEDTRRTWSGPCSPPATSTSFRLAARTRRSFNGREHKKRS